MNLGGTIKMLNRSVFKNSTAIKIFYFKFKNNFLSVLKSSIITFYALLMLLFIIKLAQSIIQRNPALKLDELDVAIAMMGFILIFLKRILEATQGKN